MNMNYLIVSIFMISMNITEGLLLRYNSPLINRFPKNKILLYVNSGGGNYIINGGNGGKNGELWSSGGGGGSYSITGKVESAVANNNDNGSVTITLNN